MLLAASGALGTRAADRPVRPTSWTEGRTYDEGWAVSPGQASPRFELEDVEGSRHRLSDFAGRPVVLVFWGSW